MNTPSSVSPSSTVSTLCAPALTYIIISFMALLASWLQNNQNAKVYCVGSLSCPVQNTTYMFVLKILWFLFWTWVLNTLCVNGYKTMAWILVAIPFLVFFTLMFGVVNMMMASGPNAESNVASNSASSTPTTSYNGKASKNSGSVVNPGEYVYGNKGDKVGFFPNEPNTQYSSYASYDSNLNNRAKFLDRESKGLVQPQNP
jgi:hypothetical protein